MGYQHANLSFITKYFLGHRGEFSKKKKKSVYEILISVLQAYILKEFIIKKKIKSLRAGKIKGLKVFFSCPLPTFGEGLPGTIPHGSSKNSLAFYHHGVLVGLSDQDLPH